MGTAAAVHDAGIHIQDVKAAVVGMYNDIFACQAIPECGFTGHIGMANKPVLRVSTGGATGMYALDTAHGMVSSGDHDVVLCLGVEKATDPYDFQAKSPTPQVVQTIAYSWDPWFERPENAHAADSYNQVGLAYKDEHPNDLDDEIQGRIIELMSKQAWDNPFAQRHETVTLQDYLNSRMIVYPSRELGICVYTEGASGIILAADGVAQEICKQNGTEPIWVVGRGFANEPYFPGVDIRKHKILHRIYSDYLAAKQAYEMAGVGPQDIEIFELHDAFVFQLMITMVECGFVQPGHANDVLELMLAGKPFVNLSGGLTFGGHFVGGSNMMSLWSVIREMRKRGLKFGMTHGTGASLAQYGGVWIVEQGERRAA